MDALPHLLRAAAPSMRFSAATAAFQVEGARGVEGRGRSIWDSFVETPGAVADGSTAEPGPDSWHRFDDDVALLRTLGVDRYRFGISWVRVIPDESLVVSPAGLDGYSRMVDQLLEAGITPFPTLYHWDLPQWLEDRGGWLSRETALRFGDFAETVIARLGDRVRHWYTVNEPVSTTLQGYAIGELAPRRTELFGALPTVHHQLLAHGLAVAAVRSAGEGEVGIVNNHTAVSAASDRDEDVAAAALYDLLHNRMFADPVLTGMYPEAEHLGLPAQPIRDGDLALISAPTDFYGVNYYNPTRVAAGAGPVPFDIVPIPGAATTGFGWPIVPEGLRELLEHLTRSYGAALPPLIIGENGASFPEPATTTGALDDQERISYLRGHLTAVAEAVAAGADVREYTVWSLVDNFEWAEGFTQRFGIVHVDQETSVRTPKASFHWYRELLAQVRA